MNTTKHRFSILFGVHLCLSVGAFFVLVSSTNAFADSPLLSLEVESSILDWQDEFVLKLNIYGSEDMELPRVTIDGLDQFQLQGTGKNLLQIPRGKTKKWVLTYTLLASDTGNFKVGPAILTYQGRSYRSNIVFLSVEPPTPRKQVRQDEERTAPEEEKKAPVQPPKQEKRQPVEPPKEEKRTPIEEPKPVPKALKPAIVLSASKVGDRILILMETRNNRPYQLQGIPVTVRLLSQLPVENLQFLDEADFPGFLRYDFPFTSKPKGEVVNYRNKLYASYDLVKFLLFPLEGGQIEIPPVRCELKVRVPSGPFPDADLKLDLERTSNLLNLNVTPSPEGAAVGDFVFRNEIVADEPESKVIRIILEGKGQLSTFNFPEIAGLHFIGRKLSESTTVKIKGESLISRKTQDVELVPDGTTTSVVLPGVRVQEFDPETATLAALQLPPVNFNFRLPGAAPKAKLAFPALPGGAVWLVYLMLGSFAAFLYLRNFRLPAPQAHLRLRKLFSNKNLKLQISKSAARNLYQQIVMQIALQEGNTSSINDSITKHLPQEEWLNVQRGLRKLERTAYSATKPVSVTYEEIQKVCEKIESLWVQ